VIFTVRISAIVFSDVKCLEAKILVSASASKIWPRPGLDLVVLLCNRAFFGQKLCFGNFVNFSGNNLNSYVVNRYLVLFS